ncbi:MAG: sensor domain-containing diguanylate cyclase [Synechococcaceae cyanobacterium]|nr:sensor domain-containing diguanylate cyclase [Synechococcaceae cyanobacterium]
MAPYPDFPIPVDEEQRLRDLERHGVIGTDSDEHLDRIVELVSLIFGTPIAMISLVEAERQWFLSSIGVDVRETPRDMAFCAHVIADSEVMVVSDALSDERFANNPLVMGEPHVRFYVGTPLRSPEGHNLGSLCAIDRVPRQVTPAQCRQLRLLGELVIRELELRRQAQQCPISGLPNRYSFLKLAQREFARASCDDLPLALLLVDVDNLRQVNDRWGHLEGDQLLHDFGRLCRSFLQEQDLAGRLGDGEFALLLIGLEAEAALALAEGLRDAVSHLGSARHGSAPPLHISGGLTLRAPGDASLDAMLRRAEQALALAKSNGRNQIASLFQSL